MLYLPKRGNDPIEGVNFTVLKDGRLQVSFGGDVGLSPGIKIAPNDVSECGDEWTFTITNGKGYKLQQVPKSTTTRFAISGVPCSIANKAANRTWKYQMQKRGRKVTGVRAHSPAE